MSARSALGITRAISHRSQQKRQADYRNVIAKRSKQRLTRNLLLESLEDRRVMDVGLSGNDEILISGSIVDSASNSQQLLDTAENIPEVRNWNWQTQAIADSDRTESVVQKQLVDQQLAQRLEDALSQSTVSASASIENPSDQPVSLGTQRVSQAISQALTSTDWGSQLQTNSTPTISQLSQSLETGQQPTNPLQLTQQKFNSQSIAEAMMRVGSPSEMIGGQLFTGSNASGLANSIGQAESRIMVSGSQGQWSSEGTSQPASDANDLGLTAQSLPLSEQQVTQVVDGSIMAGLFGQSVESPESSIPAPQAMMLAEGEGESSGDSGSSSSQQASIPHVQFPQLRFTQSSTALDSFVPTDPNSFTDVHGTPGGWGLGSNWTHTVSVNWTSDQVWSYTETLSMNFVASETETDSGLISELESDDPDNSDSNLDERLEVTGNWNSSVNTLRLGYVIMTFTASRGSSSATANSPLFNMGGGTRWSISLNFLDAVQTMASASASSAAQINPALIDSTSGGEGEEDDDSPSNPNQLPDDFTGSASWAANFVSVQAVSGTLNLSSIPFWISQGSSPETSIVDRLVTADGTTDLGNMFQADEDFVTSSQSGNLGLASDPTPDDFPIAANNPLPEGGREEVDYDSKIAALEALNNAMNTQPQPEPGEPDPSLIDPPGPSGLGGGIDPGGIFVGHGFASATSSSLASNGLSTQSGNWNLLGAYRQQYNNSRWVGVSGSANSQADADVQADASSDGRLVSIPTPSAETFGLLGGTITYKPKTFAGANLQGAVGGNVAGSANATLGMNSLGQMITTASSSDHADVDVNSQTKSSGFQSSVDEWDVEESDASTGYNLTKNIKLRYVADGARQGGGTALSHAIGQGPADASATMKRKGAGYELVQLVVDGDTAWTEPGFLYDSGTVVDDFKISFSTGYREDIDLTGQSIADQATWSGTAEHKSKGSINYLSDYDLNGAVGGSSRHDDRLAKFKKTAEYIATLNHQTQEVDTSVTPSGDSTVSVIGTWKTGLGWFEPVSEGTYGPGNRDSYELALEQIFNDWDGSLDALLAVGSPEDETETPEDEEPPPPPPTADEDNGWWGGVLNGLQAGLDVAGFVPGLGIVADVANAGVSAARGNWVDAGINLVAAFPGLGDAVKAGKIAASAGAAAVAVSKLSNAAPIKGAIEMHHLLPQSKALKPFFERAGLNIENFKIPLDVAKHRFKPDGIHTNGGGNWNKVWSDYFKNNPNANASEILEQLARMRGQFGI